MSVVAEMPGSVLEVFEPREALGLIEWARLHMHAVEGPIVADAGGQPQPWSDKTFPLQRTVMEAIDDPRWQRVVIMAAPQAFGKTMCAAVPVLLHAVEQRQVNALYVGGDESLAKKQWRDKIEPAMKVEPVLRALIHENTDLGGNWEERRFTNETSLHFAGGQQPLAAFSVPVIVFDDVQHYPPSLPAGRGHTVDDGLKRSHAFAPEQCTHVVIGTATNIEGYLWREMRASALFVPLLPCPKCGHYQLLEYERLYCEGDPDELAAVLGSTRMRCGNEECGVGIEFRKLPEMLAEHRWVSLPVGGEKRLMEGPGEDDRQGAETPRTAEREADNEEGLRVTLEGGGYPETRRNTNVAGFWANSLYWPHGMNWGQRYADYLAARRDPDKQRDFQINDQVRPWRVPEIDEERLTEEELEAHAVLGHRAGTVPIAADLVTITVDVQSGYIYYVARAWKKSDGTAWLVNCRTIGRPLRGQKLSQAQRKTRRVTGILEGLDELDKIAAEGWPVVDENGEEAGQITAALVLVDRGFEPETLASWWTLHHRGVWKLIKGQRAGERAVLWPINKSEGLRTDGRGRPWRYVDVNVAKHVLRRLLRVAPGKAGYWHFPGQGLHANTIKAYMSHLASEQWRTDLKPPRWKPVTPGAANHFLDCETYQISAARAVGVRLAGFAPPAEKKKKPRRRSAARSERKVRRRY